MILTITKEQELMLQQTVLTSGRNAWEYIHSRSEDERPCVMPDMPRLMIGQMY